MELTNEQVKRLCAEDVWNATLTEHYVNDKYYVFKQKKKPTDKDNWYEYRLELRSGWYGRYECGMKPGVSGGGHIPYVVRQLNHKVKHIKKLYEILYNK